MENKNINHETSVPWAVVDPDWSAKNGLSDEVTYWKTIACWLGDVLAETALRQVSAGNINVAEKERQLIISVTAAAALDGRYHPEVRVIQNVVEKLLSVGFSTVSTAQKTLLPPLIEGPP